MKIAAAFLTTVLMAGARGDDGTRAPELTVWLLPAEEAPESEDVDINAVQRQIEDFNSSEVPAGVVLENTTQPVLREQLLGWNPEFAMPNWAWVRGQRITLRALGRFAARHGVRVRVRFHTWANAFSALDSGVHNGRLPDVAQIGSTWVSHFAPDLLAPDASAPGRWRKDAEGMPRSLRYFTDVRLLFYRKRSPSAPAGSPEFVPATDSWTGLVASLENHAAPPFVMPVGLTFNLMHDLFPLLAPDPAALVIRTGFRTQFRIAGNEQLRVLHHFARKSVIRDARGMPRRIIAFPEVTHEEAIRFFQAAGFSGIIEPVGFLRRWHDQFQRQLGKAHPEGGFWRLAGAVAPPSVFRGGSDLAVLRHTRHRKLAWDLAVFLASDPEYTGMLCDGGNLPVQFGDAAIDRLIRAVAATAGPGDREAIAAQVRLALARSREYPEMSQWATEVEDRAVLEKIQQLWRRTAEANPAAIDQAAQELEDELNRRVDAVARLFTALTKYRIEILTIVAGVAMLLVASYRRRARMLDQMRRIRGFSASGLAMIDGVHQRWNPFRGGGATRDEADKSAVISVGLLGLRRGLAERLWDSASVDDVAWRAVLLAVGSILDVTLARRYEESGKSALAFLRAEELLRDREEFTQGASPFFIAVHGPAHLPVPLPYLMEQALLCLIQNALKASLTRTDAGEAFYLPIVITAGRGGIRVENTLSPHVGKRPSERLIALLNSAPDMSEFDRRVHEFLSGPVDDRPGIGLVEAYSIARICYAGMFMEFDGERVACTINLRRNGVARLVDAVRQNRTARSRAAAGG